MRVVIDSCQLSSFRAPPVVGGPETTLERRAIRLMGLSITNYGTLDAGTVKFLNNSGLVESNDWSWA